MKIEVNRSYTFQVNEKNLTVKDKKLYNLKTKEYEGVEGDLVTISYEENGKAHELKGTVGGYTCGEHVVIRPNYEYNNVKSKKIEHIGTVVLLEENTDDEEALALMTQE